MCTIACRNCGNDNINYSTATDNVIHYDCLDCNYEWSAPPIKEGQMLLNIIAGLAGLLLIIFGLAPMLRHLNAAFRAQSTLALLVTGMALVFLFAYRSLRAYRLIRK